MRIPHHPVPAFAWAAALTCAAFLFLSSCGNNVGRLFDPNIGGPGSEVGTVSTVQVMEVGGVAVEGRPQMLEAFPQGAGWPTTVPIVLVFNESLNEDSVVPPAAAMAEPTIFARVEGTEAAIPASYDFLLGGTVVVMRPAMLAAPMGEMIEVVVSPDLRDADGVRFGGTEPEVVATFSPDATAATDGRIVTTLPRRNVENQLRETPVYAIFTMPADEASLSLSNFFVRTAAGNVPGVVSFPIAAAPNVQETRIAQFVPENDGIFEGGVEHEIVFEDTITFGGGPNVSGGGSLDFDGRTPFSTFTTATSPAPESVAIGNATMGFDDSINRSNIGNLLVDVTLGADADDDDRVVARLYGIDATSESRTEVVFVERSADVPLIGMQTVTVDFSGALGDAAAPLFAEGSIALRAQVVRGRQQTGFIRSSDTVSPRFDITPPSIVSLGPPVAGMATDVVTDQEHLALFGVASERVGAAELQVGGATAALYAGSADGRFQMEPLSLGVLPTGLTTYALTLTDAAGNMTTTAQSGTVVQRGIVSGTGSGGAMPLGDLTVSVYDEATFLPVAGATVVVEPGRPQKPAVGQQTAVTNALGTATLPGLADPRYTITVVADGFDLFTLLDVESTFVSLPLRPLMGSTATLTGAVVGNDIITGQRGTIGSNVFADRGLESVTSTAAANREIPATTVRSGRPVFATAFYGSVPPTSAPTFTSFACSLCGVDGMTPTPPLAPLAAGASAAIELTAVAAPPPSMTSPGVAVSLLSPLMIDFGSSAGLGTLDGTPSVAVVASLNGIGGASLAGTGFATAVGGDAFSVQSTHASVIPQALDGFGPLLWVSTEARDVDGNMARQRTIIIDIAIGMPGTPVPAPGVATITPPGGPSSGAPVVLYDDVLDAMPMVTGVAGLFGANELRATDPSGRGWTVLWADTDNVAGASSLQIPDLSALPVTGLATGGDWIVEIASTLFVAPAATPTSWVFEDRFRTEVTRGVTRSVAFNVQAP